MALAKNIVPNSEKQTPNSAGNFSLRALPHQNDAPVTAAAPRPRL
jgi:hypothetical protein